MNRATGTPTPAEQFTRLLDEEVKRLSDRESALAAAQTAVDRAKAALVNGKLDGAADRQIVTLEEDLIAAQASVAQAQQAVDRQADHIARLQAANAERETHRAIAETSAALSEVQARWPAVRDRVAKAYGELQLAWAAMNGIAAEELAAHRAAVDARRGATWIVDGERANVPMVVPVAARSELPVKSGQIEALSGAVADSEYVDRVRRKQRSAEWAAAVEADRQAQAEARETLGWGAVERLHG